MTEIYRLTVRTVDGVRFISDYDKDYEARSKMHAFMVSDKNLLSYKWCVGDDRVVISLDKITSVTVMKVILPDADTLEETKVPSTSQMKQPANYIGKIHVVEVNPDNC